jgi:hypothetical protein
MTLQFKFVTAFDGSKRALENPEYKIMPRARPIFEKDAEKIEKETGAQHAIQAQDVA